MAKWTSASESSTSLERASSSSTALLAEGTSASGTSNGMNSHRQDGLGPGAQDIPPQAAGFGNGSTPPTSASIRNTFTLMNESSTSSERASSSSTALLAEGTSASGTLNGMNGHCQDGLGPGAQDISSAGFGDCSTPSADASTQDTFALINVTDAGNAATTTSTIRKGKHKERPIVLSDIEGNESPLTDIGEDQTTPKKHKTSKSKASEKSGSRKSARSCK